MTAPDALAVVACLLTSWTAGIGAGALIQSIRLRRH